MTPFTKKINCLLLTNLYPNSQEPERGVFVKQLVDELRKNMDITIVSPLPYFPIFKPLGVFKKWRKYSLIQYKEMELDGEYVYYPKYFVFPRLTTWIQSILMYLSIYKLLSRLHKANKFDVINAQWLYPDGVAGLWVAKKLGIPIVLTGHGSDVHRDLKVPIIRWQILHSLKKADFIVLVSDSLAEIVVGCGVSPQKIKVIPNGVHWELHNDIDRDEARRQLGLNDGNKHLLFVGRLVEVKGLKYLIQASKYIDNDDIVFHIIGDGPLLEGLKTLTRIIGVENKFRFEGQKRHNEVMRWMKAADIFCLPSLQEGCPNVILEAISAGTPIVASSVGAIPLLIKDGIGFTIPPSDVESLAEKLNIALEKYWDRNMISSHAEIYGWDKIAMKYIELYNNIIIMR